jgi:predicted transcriptional regulator
MTSQPKEEIIRPGRLFPVTTPSDTDTLTLPPALLAEVQAAADEERRPAGAVLREAVERYLRERRWQKIFAYGEQRARELGLTEQDVPRLIAEYRREERQGR